MLKKMYGAVSAVETVLVPVFVVAITALVFISALFRTFNAPINWAVDMSLLLLAWTVGLGGDLAIKRDRVVNVDMLVNLFPPKARKFIALLWCAVIAVFLGYMVKYGWDLCWSNRKRVFQTLGINYNWANASVIIGSFLMLVSMSVRFGKIWLDLPLTPPPSPDADPEMGELS